MLNVYLSWAKLKHEKHGNDYNNYTTNAALEMKQRQVELTKVDEELKKRNQEILDLQLRLHEAEKTLVRPLPCMERCMTL